ncbi:MAG: S-adenosylmethionine:tRNA ribosyltransferase-isomerase [Chloroflexi bacterium]|nr:S-adenosylmethionine:tRNA ribosyltransferase-isomerase [Chloroflexota bacterium]
MINAARAGSRRVIAVNTTSARVLETTIGQAEDGQVHPFEGFPSLYITPGYRWRAMNAPIANFHLSRSTLLRSAHSWG